MTTPISGMPINAKYSVNAGLRSRYAAEGSGYLPCGTAEGDAARLS